MTFGAGGGIMNPEKIREKIENCWIELEAATTWEEISRIEKELIAYGRQYKQTRQASAIGE